MGKREEDVLPGRQTVSKVLFGILGGLLLTLLLLAFWAALVSGGALSTQNVNAIVMVSLAIGAFLASLFAARKHKGKRWMLGAAVGLGMFFLLFVFGLLFSFPPSSVPQIMAASVIGGLLGGLMGARRKHTKRK